jgi:CheY-like chemotaxis protein
VQASEQRPHVLIVDPDWISETPSAFESAGFQVQTACEVAAVARAAPPDAILLRADVGSAVYRELLKVLSATAGMEAVPLILLTHDAHDASIASRFRHGLIEILAEPFEPSVHPAHVAQVLASLPARWGSFSPPEPLARFLEHVRDAQRSGEVIVSQGGAEIGRATFVRGVLQTARAFGEAGPSAMAKLRRIEAPYRFLETSPGTSDRAIGVPTAHSRVLLVDDDPELREVLSTFLTQHGFEVSCAEDGQRGCAIAASQPIDLVIADLHMPTFDGWGMLRSLGSDYRTREIPVAVLSGHDEYRDLLRARSAGARLYLAKGSRLDMLPHEVVTMLEPRRELLARVGLHSRLRVPIAELGPQWTLRALAQVGATGTLEATDRLAYFTLGFRDGRLLHAHAMLDNGEIVGSRALNAFIASQDAEGEFTAGAQAGDQNVVGTVDEQVVQAQQVLNVCLTATNEVRIVNGSSVKVDPELYALYAQLCPPQVRETVRLVCEERLSAREAIARSDRSPIEIEETYTDLVRREVISVQAG